MCAGGRGGGSRPPECTSGGVAEPYWNGGPERVRAPSAKPCRLGLPSASTTGHEQAGGKRGRPRPKAKYLAGPIVHSTVRER